MMSLMAYSHQAKVGGKAEKIKRQAKNTKNNRQTSKKSPSSTYAFCVMQIGLKHFVSGMFSFVVLVPNFFFFFFLQIKHNCSLNLSLT